MADDGISVVLVFFKEVIGPGKCDLVDVFINFLCGHTDTAVANGYRLGIFVDSDTNGQITHFSFEITF